MAIRHFEDKQPDIAASAYVDDTAVIIGDVTIEEESSIWPNVVIRGDINQISIGKRTNIQDGSVLHVTHAGLFHPNGSPVHIGNDVTVGHQVTLHGCTIADYCLIGIGSIVMDDVMIESEVILGAHSLVPPRKILTSGYLWLGSPAKKIRPLSDEEKQFLRYSATYYVKLGKRHTKSASR
jgi:carbonic anhydrase/acetyltransferase-like protein (isoleucine patch superfamily)